MTNKKISPIVGTWRGTRSPMPTSSAWPPRPKPATTSPLCDPAAVVHRWAPAPPKWYPYTSIQSCAPPWRHAPQLTTPPRARSSAKRSAVSSTSPELPWPGGWQKRGRGGKGRQMRVNPGHWRSLWGTRKRTLTSEARCRPAARAAERRTSHSLAHPASGMTRTVEWLSATAEKPEARGSLSTTTPATPTKSPGSTSDECPDGRRISIRPASSTRPR